jgi:GNAT superfamily N-acetyltransferase
MSKSNYIIKRLNNSHREKVLGHFLRLDKESLYSRFCSHQNEYLLNLYVSRIDFDKNGIFGIFDDSLKIIGVGECVIEENTNRAEVGFSVEINHQGQGLGGRLLKRIVRFAKTREKTHLEMLCLRTNQKSQHLAKKFGLKIQNTFGSESLGIIDIKDVKPEIEEIQEKIEDTMAYCALTQKEQINTWKTTQEICNEMMSNLFINTLKFMLGSHH